MTIQVLLVDDSAVIRGLITQALERDPLIKVAASAANGASAIQLARQIQPNIIILDIEMPQMDGLTALPHLVSVAPKSKIIMASTLTERNAAISLEALAKGASDYLAKPSARNKEELQVFYHELINKVRALSGHPPAALMPMESTVQSIVPLPKPPYVSPVLRSAPIVTGRQRALAIASSTGGPQALMKIFTSLNGKLMNVPIYITQHMPPTFTAILGEQISKVVGRSCREAKDGEQAQPGGIYIAPGNFHMQVRNEAGHPVIHLDQEPPINFCRPAADPMLASLSAVYGDALLVVVLTGMGQDGMEGSKVVVEHGGTVIAQDEASCVVYGMPKAVADQGLCQAILPLQDIPDYIIKRF